MSTASSSMGGMEDGGRRSGRGHVSALEMGNDDTEYYHDNDEDTEYYDDIDIRRVKKKKNSSRIVSGEYGGISSEEDDDDDDDDEQYAHLTTGTATTRRSQLLCTKQCWCILLTVIIAAMALLVKYDNNGNLSFRNNGGSFTPPWSTNNKNDNNNNIPMLGRPVTHSAYTTIQTSYIIEYTGQLTLYKHISTGAEVLAYIPDLSTPSPTTGGSSSSNNNSKKDKDSNNNVGYDPKPDKVFGVAFRTKPESSTGVPHILEREYMYIFCLFTCISCIWS
jgi:hypothetical protein